LGLQEKRGGGLLGWLMPAHVNPGRKKPLPRDYIEQRLALRKFNTGVMGAGVGSMAAAASLPVTGPFIVKEGGAIAVDKATGLPVSDVVGIKGMIKGASKALGRHTSNKAKQKAASAAKSRPSSGSNSPEGKPNYSQGYVEKETTLEYKKKMENRQWEYERSPLNVTSVDGVDVSLDNRRLRAAEMAGTTDKLQWNRVELDDVMQGGGTYRKNLEKKLNSRPPKRPDLPKIQLSPTGTPKSPKLVDKYPPK